MNCKFVVTVAAVLLMTALTSWAAEDGAALYKSSIREGVLAATARMVKASPR